MKPILTVSIATLALSLAACGDPSEAYTPVADLPSAQDPAVRGDSMGTSGDRALPEPVDPMLPPPDPEDPPMDPQVPPPMDPVPPLDDALRPPPVDPTMDDSDPVLPPDPTA